MKKRSILTMAAAGGIAAYAALRIVKEARASRSIRTGPHVVILGAGFGGLSAASKLTRLSSSVRVSIVDQHNYHLFTPMLYQVASCSTLPYDVAVPLRNFSSAWGIQFYKACVDGIDLGAKQVHTSSGPVPYDYLIIALGSTTNFFGERSAQQHAMALKSLEDGVRIRNHVIDTLEQASRSTDPAERHQLLSFVIIGGGATGVETAGALSDVVRHVIRKDYPDLNSDESRVILVESGPKLLGHMSTEMAVIALRELQKAGVDVWMNTKAEQVEPGLVKTSDGRSIYARTIIWATGVQAADVVARLPVPHGNGSAVLVNQCLQIPGHHEVFAIGDNAHVEERNQTVPLLAAAAVQQGQAAALNIVHMLNQRAPIPFRYRNLGNVVSVGHGVGVADIGGRILDGFAGWLIWRIVHLIRIHSFRNKVATAIDWVSALTYDVDTARIEFDHPNKAA